MGKKALLAILVTTAVITPPVLDYVYQNVTPFIKAAKLFDKTDGKDPVPCPGKILCTLRRYYFVDNNCPANAFFIYKAESNNLERYPNWVLEGKEEILINYMFPTNVGMKAMYAAKYLVMEPLLSVEAKRAIKVIGTAYFDYYYRFTKEQLQILKDALIFYLRTKG